MNTVASEQQDKGNSSAQTSTAANPSSSASTTTASNDTTAQPKNDTTTSTNVGVSAGSTAATVASAATTGDITTRITEWRLGATDIQADLDSGTAIVRTREIGAGAPTGNTDDSVLKTMVKGKLQADSVLSSAAAGIDVDAHNGEITLSGQAQSADQVGRAIAIALNTEGVTKVTSQLKVSTASK